MLSRLFRTEELASPKPLHPTLVSIAAQNPSPKRRRNHYRICRLYRQPEPETRIHARALVAFIQEHCADAIGAYIPCCDLDRFYREDLCALKGWEARHWTAVARQLGTLTHKRSIRRNGQRFVGYQVPRP